MSESIEFTVHHNWDWVVEAAFFELGWKEKAIKKGTVRDLSSYKAGFARRGYALFRVENNVHEEDSLLPAFALSATCKAFEEIDRKDTLYRLLEGSNTMPFTKLLPWNLLLPTDGERDLEDIEGKEVDIDREGREDIEDIEDIEGKSRTLVGNLPTIPAILKSSIGSGGWGLFFVHTPADVLRIIRSNANAALKSNGFIASLERTYGNMPCWGLQSLVDSVRIKDGRKPQIRAYFYTIGGSLYYYKSFEVRLPLWDKEQEQEKEKEREKDGEEVVGEMELELSHCIGCAPNTRPYNYLRNKRATERYTLTELSELAGASERIESLLQSVGSRLTDLLTHPSSTTTTTSSSTTATTTTSITAAELKLTECAIIGCDLMLDQDLKPYLVEVNNNPAMPGPGKNMTELYRFQLVGMVADMLRLGSKGDIGAFVRIEKDFGEGKGVGGEVDFDIPPLTSYQFHPPRATAILLLLAVGAGILLKMMTASASWDGLRFGDMFGVNFSENSKFMRTSWLTPVQIDSITYMDACKAGVVELSTPLSLACCDIMQPYLHPCSHAYSSVVAALSGSGACLFPLISPLVQLVSTFFLSKSLPFSPGSFSSTLYRLRLYFAICLYRIIFLYIFLGHLQKLFNNIASIPDSEVIGEVEGGPSIDSCWYTDLGLSLNYKHQQHGCMPTSFDFSDHIVLYGTQYILPASIEVWALDGTSIVGKVWKYVLSFLACNSKSGSDSGSRSSADSPSILHLVLLTYNILIILFVMQCSFFTAVYFHSPFESAVGYILVLVFVLFPIGMVSKYSSFQNQIRDTENMKNKRFD